MPAAREGSANVSNRCWLKRSLFMARQLISCLGQCELPADDLVELSEDPQCRFLYLEAGVVDLDELDLLEPVQFPHLLENQFVFWRPFNDSVNHDVVVLAMGAFLCSRLGASDAFFWRCREEQEDRKVPLFEHFLKGEHELIDVAIPAVGVIQTAAMNRSHSELALDVLEYGRVWHHFAMFGGSIGFVAFLNFGSAMVAH